MYKSIKKYQKKLLAVFAVLLMIAFVATLGPGNPGGRASRADIVVGRINSGKINEAELQLAKDQWQTAMRIPIQTQQAFGQQIPLPYAVLPPSVAEDVQKHPELFLLLQKEARQNGIVVNLDEAKSIWVNYVHQPIETLSQMDALAIQNVLLVGSQCDQLAQAVKVSQPMWRREAAQQFQGVRLNLVDFRAEDYEKSVPAPTPQQLQEQFDKYKNKPARQPDSTLDDSLGFGYQIPTRVTVQYLQISKSQVVASLQPTPESRYEWEVKAALYYEKNKEEFRNPDTQPASQPAATQTATTQSSQPALAASQPSVTSTQPVVAASQPAIKSFAQVKEEIVDKLIAPDVAKQTALIEKEIASQLGADWIAIRKANSAATQPATTQMAAASQPAASQPVLAEMSLARLEALRADIQQKLHVSIEIHELSAWQDAKQLGALPGVGSAQTADHDRFADYAMNFTGQSSSLISAVRLQVWEPSQPLTDTTGDAFVFRLTSAEPAHAPTDFTPLLPQLTKDWRTAQSYELAKQAGTKLADSAKANGLSQAARTAGVTVLLTGQFSPRNPRNITGYPLTDSVAEQDLGQAARKLLEQATQSDPHPSMMFEMPTIQRVAVADLASTRLELPEWYVQTEVLNSTRQNERSKLCEDYFAYDAVVDRLGYKADTKAGS
jgi:hypothetical protein